MKKTRQITLCGLLSALSFVLIFLGTAISVLCYTMPLLTSLIMIIASKAINEKSAWIIFTVVSILTFLFMPDKECCMTYIFFFGYYPIIKPHLDNIRQKFLRIVIKLLIFNLGIASSQAILFYAFGIPFDNMFGKCTILILLGLANIVLLIYEICLNSVTTPYMKKLHKKLVNLIKRK